MTIITKQ